MKNKAIVLLAVAACIAAALAIKAGTQPFTEGRIAGGLGIISFSAGASMNVTPSYQKVELGKNVTVAIAVNGVTNLYGMQFDVAYDPTMLRLNSYSDGPFLTKDGKSVFTIPPIQSSGRLDDYVAVRYGTDYGVNGSGVVMSISFQAISAGSAYVRVENGMLMDPNINPIPHSYGSGTVEVRVNRPPVLSQIGNRSATEGQTISFAISASDPDGDQLAYSATGLPAGADFNPATRVFNWTPGYSQAGRYVMVFTVTDGALTDSEAVAIDVANFNRPPVLSQIGSKTVVENSQMIIIINASDPDGDRLAYSAGGMPAGANFNATSRVFSWRPGFGSSGSYAVTFAATDSSLNDSETITIKVVKFNRPPVLSQIGSKTVSEGQVLAFSVSASDPDGDQLAYSATGLPAGADFNATSRAFSWRPSFSQSGTYAVTFTASDGGMQDSETIAITVANVNRAPVIKPIANMSVDENKTVSFAVESADADGDRLTYDAIGLPAGASLNRTDGTFRWTPTTVQSGKYAITFFVSDGMAQASQAVWITVADSCRGDTDGNGRIELSDLIRVAISFNKPAFDRTADVSGDGFVSLLDLVIVSINYGKRC